MTVVLPRDREVRFDPKPINALRVTVQDREGYLARMGFESGDLIVNMDGVEFENMYQMQAAFGGAMSKEEVTVTVLRGGREFDLRLEPRKMMDHEDLGGNLDPAGR